MKIENDTEWLLATMRWLSDTSLNGGITTCNKHKGIGFPSDCAICNRLEKIQLKVNESQLTRLLH